MSPFFLLIIVPILLGLWAQTKVQSTYRHYLKQRTRAGRTGRQVAAQMLQEAGIHDVSITTTRGMLTDHYDPAGKRLVLSEANFHGDTVSAVGVAAHEAGHAIQHKVNYSMLNLRMNLVPLTTIASQFLPFVLFGGFIMKSIGLIWLGVAAYAVLTFFQLVTLPVEFDASRRASKALGGMGILNQDEATGVTRVLDAAAWTYVAAFVSSLGWLLYFLSSVLGQSRSD